MKPGTSILSRNSLTETQNIYIFCIIVVLVKAKKYPMIRKLSFILTNLVVKRKLAMNKTAAFTIIYMYRLKDYIRERRDLNPRPSA